MSNRYKLDAKNVLKALKKLQNGLGRKQFRESEIFDYLKMRGYKDTEREVNLKIQYLLYRGAISRIVRSDTHHYYYVRTSEESF